MELPGADLELINALQIAPRATWTQLGTALGRNPTTLATRWERLSGEGLAWVTAHRGASALQGCYSFIGIECRPGSRAKVLARLCAIPEIGTVDEAARTWDFRLTVITRDYQQLTREILPLLRKDPDIVRTHLSVVTRMAVMGHQWRLDVLSPAQQTRVAEHHPEATRPPGATPPHFDRMMEVLVRNGRATAAEIAQATGSHPTTAARQLGQAIETGLVVLRCELAQEYSGYPVACQWYARVPPDKFEAAENHLRTHRTLRLCAFTSGETNLTFYLWLRHPGEIQDVEAGLHAAVPGIQIVESEVGVRPHKRMGWMLNEDSRATGEVIVPRG